MYDCSSALNFQLVHVGFVLTLGVHFRIGSDFSKLLVAFDLDFPLFELSAFFIPLFFFCFFFSPFPLFFGPFVTPVKVRGEALGKVSSIPHSSSTPPLMQSLVIIHGCGIIPLQLPSEYPKIDFSIIFPTFIL